MTHEATRLAACPFCSGACAITKGYSTSELPWSDDGGDFFRAYCSKCQSRQLFHRTESDAIEAWNRRAALAQPAPTAEVALPAVSEPGPWIPRNAADVRDFLGSHCMSLTYGDPSNPETATDNDAYELTAHDLLSAFVWAGHFDGELAARAQSAAKGDEGTV